MSHSSKSRKVRWPAAVLATTTLAAGAAFVVRRRWRERGRFTTAISDTVTISRDERGVPHITAANRDDALFGLGYAMAEDRLWQLDIYRRTAFGRLAEIAGPDALGSDKVMRLLGMRRIANRLVEVLDDATRAGVEAFAAGVNHRIDSGPLPVEFRVSRYQPEPWMPADSAAVFRLLAWTLGAELDADITGEQLREVLGDEWTDAIYLGSYPDIPPIVRQGSAEITGNPKPAERMPLFPEWGASNAWAVAAERSVTGAPLLASDPHLELQNPSIWYEAALDAPNFQVTGMTVTGFPGIGIGRTPTLAWGLTAGMIPQTFLYKEELNEGGTHFHEGGEWMPLRLHDEVIEVRGEPEVILRVRYTPRGPLVSDIRPELEGQAVSLHWTGMEESHELRAILHANASSSVDDLLPVRDSFGVPTFNMIAADSGGTIAMIGIGRTAVRDRRVGLLAPEEFPPWYIAPDDMPLEVNPERGWVACCNNCVVGEDYPYPIHGLWLPGFRARRIAAELDSRRRHSPAEMRLLQLDIRCEHAADCVPALVDLLEGQVPEWAVEDLRDWDYRATPESRATLLFESFYYHWTREALAHRLPEHMVERLLTHSGSLAAPELFVDRILRGEFPAWMDGPARHEAAVRAFQSALAWLAERLGDDESQWTWGDLHTLTFRHPFSAIAGPHRLRTDVGPFAVGGTRFTVAPMHWRRSRPFEVEAGASMRFVASLGRPEDTWATNTLGESGSPLSRRYRDQVGDYLQGYMHRPWPYPVRERRALKIAPVGKSVR
jgi:penicillin G amidase